jgi:hypothetical protein
MAMKHGSVATIVLLAAAMATGARGQGSTDVTSESLKYAHAEKYRSANLENIVPKYLWCLSNGNSGVVTSSIGVLARLSLYNEHVALPKLRAELTRLTGAENSAPVRYRAYLLGMLLDNPEWFREERSKEYMTDDDLFLALSNRMARTILTRSESLVVNAAAR